MHYKKNLFRIVLFGGDFFLLYATLVGTLMVREGTWAVPATLPIFLNHFFFLQIPIVVLLYLLDFYDVPPLKRMYDSLFKLLLFFIGSFSISAIYFYFNQNGVVGPKTILLIHLGIFSVFIFMWRLFLVRFVPKRKQIGVILGFHPLCVGVLQRMKDDFHRIFLFASYEEEEKYTPFLSMIEIGLLKKMDELHTVVARQKIDLVINASGDISQIISILPNLRGGVIQDIEQWYGTLFLKVPLSMIESRSTLNAVVLLTQKKWLFFFKRMFDMCISVVGLLMTIILLPCIAVGIKSTSRGPLLYRQKRMGKGGCVFTLYKFRTMYIGAEQDGPRLAQPNDTRITPVGRFLRKFHIDEFPQFFNMLRGELSFVGPRPERPEFTRELLEKIPYYPLRHVLKPGMTGWAQVYYKASTTTEETREKFEYDVYYIKYCSPILDFRIIIKTIQMIIFNKKFS